VPRRWSAVGARSRSAMLCASGAYATRSGPNATASATIVTSAAAGATRARSDRERGGRAAIMNVRRRGAVMTAIRAAEPPLRDLVIGRRAGGPREEC